jgi:hypothetical protein
MTETYSLSKDNLIYGQFPNSISGILTSLGNSMTGSTACYPGIGHPDELIEQGSLHKPAARLSSW